MDYFYNYDNVTDYYSQCIKPTQSRHISSVTNRELFAGSISLDVTKERFVKGYPEGSLEARKLLMQLTPYVRSIAGTKKGWKAQVYGGGNFILNNYVRGLPELCNTMSPVVSKKFCSVIYNMTASCGVSTNVLQRRGIIAVALINILEQHGYRVAVKVVYGEKGRSHNLFASVTLKDFNQHMDGDRLAFFLSDPSAFRRLNFAFMESLPDPIPTDILDQSYGRPIDLPSSMIGPNDIYFTKASFTDDCWHTLEGTIGYMRETLKRYGIDMRGT